MEDILSIQEFSKVSGVEASTLRYWDEIGIFSPIKRHPDNNYRYYSTAQLLALNFVTVLSDLEIPLKTIADLRNERDPEKLLALLEKQEHQMDMEMRRLRLRYSIIHARRELINQGAKIDESAISVEHLDEKAMILWPENKYEEGDTFIEPLAAFVPLIDDYHINLSFPVAGYYNNIESLKSHPNRPNRFISLDPIGTHIRKAGEYLVGYTRGYYGDFGDLPERMAAYAKEHSINITGSVYALYLWEETCTQEQSQYLVQCSIAIPKKRAGSSSAKKLQRV